MICAMITRRPMSRMIEATISRYSAEGVEELSKKRARRFLDFLDISPEEFFGVGEGRQSREASVRMVEAVSKEYQRGVVDWFLKEIKDILPVGYFEKENLENQPWLKQFVDGLYLSLKDASKFSLRQAIKGLATEAGLKGIRSEDDVFISDDEAEEYLPILLEFIKQHKETIQESLGENIQRYLRAGPKSDPERRRPERQFAEAFFQPRVDSKLYGRYKEYLVKNADRYPELLSKAKEKGRGLMPEDIGIEEGKVDPYAVDILGKMKNFKVQIHDRRPVLDPREKTTTWQITFSIPALAKEQPSLYKDALFTMRLPPEVYARQFAEEREKADEDYVALETLGMSPKKGVTLRFTDTYDAYSRGSAAVVRRTGFGSPDIAKLFMHKVIGGSFVNYLKNRVFERDIDKAIEVMGGSIGIRGKGKLLPGGEFETMGEYGGEEPGIREETRERSEEEAREEISQQRSETAQKVRDVVDVYGSETVQQYLMSMDPDEAEGMKKAIVNEFSSMRDVVEKAKTGKAISYKDLLETEEIISEIVNFIFDPALEDVESEWGTEIRGIMTGDAIRRIPGFRDAVALEIYRQRLLAELKNPARVTQKIVVTPLSEIRESVRDEDVVGYMRSIITPEQYTSDLRKKLQDIIKDLGSRNHPAFRYFFQRRKAWHGYLKPQLVKFLTDAAFGIANTDFIEDKTLKVRMEKLLTEEERRLFREKKDRRKTLNREIRKAQKEEDSKKEQELRSQVETEFSTPIVNLESDNTAKFFDFLRKEFISDVIRRKTVRTKQSDEINLALIKMTMMKMARTEEYHG